MTNDKALPSEIWHLKGSDQSGPNVLVLGAVHGNEKAAIKSIKYFLEKLGIADRPGVYERDDVIGNLYLGFGNPKAIELDKRCVADDLNRIMYPELIDSKPKDDDSEDLKRARELAPLLRKIDYFIDIHTTSSQTVPYIGMSVDDNKQRRELCKFVPAEFILTDPDRRLTKLDLKVTPTMDAYVGLYGGIGIIYEAMNKDDIPVHQKGYVVASRILKEIGVVSEALLGVINVKVDDAEYHQDVYAFDKKVIAKHGVFSYQNGEALNWQPVKKGEVVGSYENGEREIAEIDGRIVFPSIPSRIKKGESLFYIARKIG